MSDLNRQPGSLGYAVMEPYRFALEGLVPFVLARQVGARLKVVDLTSWGWEIHRSLLRALPHVKGSLVYAHYPIPHWLYVRYDPASQRLYGSELELDSLLAVDALVGEIRATLEGADA